MVYLKFRTFYVNDKESCCPRMILMNPKIFFNIHFKFQRLTSSFTNNMLQLYPGLHIGLNLGAYPFKTCSRLHKTLITGQISDREVL